MKTFNKSEILNRLKEALNLSTDTELSTYLNISKSTLSNWNSRNSIDYDLVFSKCEHLNVNWLLTGEGNIFKNEEYNPNRTFNENSYKSIEKQDTSMNDIAILREMIDLLSKTNNDLLTDKKKLDCKIDKLDKQIEMLNNKIDKLELKNEELQRKNEALRETAKQQRTAGVA